MQKSSQKEGERASSQSSNHRWPSSRPPSSHSRTSDQSQGKPVSNPKQPSANSQSSDVNSQRRQPLLREPASAACLFSLCRQSNSPIHGQGLFANQSLSRGDLILRDPPLVRFSKQTDVPYEQVWQAYISLSSSDRRKWYQLSHKRGSEYDPKFMKNQEVVLPTTRRLRADVLAKWENNNFGSIYEDSFLCVLASRFNHRYSQYPRRLEELKDR
jgi:hypothetical protein